MTSLKDTLTALLERAREARQKKAGITAAPSAPPASPHRHESVVNADPYAFATAYARQA
ncbi:hypothetical protein FHS48_004004, partial [Novispirillum itersonii]|nr:hypothetical protein [Novispirillum itersonii]